MKKETVFKEPLLVSQEEMAVFLGVSRSQWAMYTLGQRGLSIQAKIKLEQLLLSNCEVSFFKKEKLVQENNQEIEAQNLLANLLQNNKYKQLQLQKKITALEGKYQAAVNTLHLINHLNKGKIKLDTAVLELLTKKANKVLVANGLPKQEVCKMKFKVLEYEESLLKEREKKL